MLLVVLAFPAVFSGVSLLGIQYQDMLGARAEKRWNQRSYVILEREQRIGELSLLTGSIVNRQDPRIPGTEDEPVTLETLSVVRFPSAQTVAGVPVVALDVSGGLMELAADHLFVLADEGGKTRTVLCEAGWLAQFRLPSGRAFLSADAFQLDGDAFFKPGHWRFDTCFSGDPIRVLVWESDGVRVLP